MTTDDVAAAATRVLTARGDLVALDLSAERLQPLVDRLDLEIDDDRTTVRVVLGALVLVDDGYGWEKSRFGSAAATGRAATDGWRHAARHRYVRHTLDV